MRTSQPNNQKSLTEKISDLCFGGIAKGFALLRINKTVVKKNSSMNKVAIASTVITVGLMALIGRIVYIQHNNKDNYNHKILTDLYYDSYELPFKRGEILDRDGNVLAKSTKYYRLILDPRQVIEPDKNGGNKTENEREKAEQNINLTARLISDVFGDDPQEIQDLFYNNSTSSYVKFKDDLTYDDITRMNARIEEIKEERKQLRDNNQIEEAKALEGSFIGYHFEEKYVRSYPNGDLACDVIGFSGNDPSQGTAGIEQQYNSYLIGTNGREYGYLNDITALERNIIPPSNGQVVVSTISLNIQEIVERHIAQREAETGSERTAVIIMDPNSGEILAMATSKGYDLNNPRDLSRYYPQQEIDAMDDQAKLEALSKMWKNYIVSDTFEPGSPSKIFTVGAAFEENVIDGTEHFICNGFLDITGVPINCGVREGHGDMDVETSIMKSCNVAMMDIAARLGVDRFTKYQRIFGFGIRTGVDLPGEPSTSNLVHNAQSMSAVDLATNSFGQNYNATMLQVAAAFCSAINGGSYYEPHVVKRIEDEKGSLIKDMKPKVVRETISQDTSVYLRHALRRTVLEGTGIAAAVPGYEVGGKTGTAETYPRRMGDYVVSFAGFAPANSPQVFCYVVIDRPHVEDQAHSTYASTLFSSIMSEVLPAMNIFTNTANPEQGSQDAGLPAAEGFSQNTVVNQGNVSEEFIPRDGQSMPASELLGESQEENTGLNIQETNAQGERLVKPSETESIPQMTEASKKEEVIEASKVSKPTAASQTVEVISPEKIGQ